MTLDKMSAVMGILVVIVSAVPLSTGKKDIPICSSDKSCYTHPANCKFEDCDFILSIGEHSTEIYSKSVAWDEFFIVQTERSGLLDDRIFTCFGKNAYCWLGVDRNIPDVPYTLDPKHRVLSDLTVISAADKEYVNEMPEGVIPYTPKLKYFFRTGTAGVYTNPIIRTELHHVTDATKQRELNEELNAYVNQQKPEKQEIVSDERFKRVAESGDTISLDVFLNDRFGQGVPSE